jgi:hypothetical protein
MEVLASTLPLMQAYCLCIPMSCIHAKSASNMHNDTDLYPLTLIYPACKLKQQSKWHCSRALSCSTAHGGCRTPHAPPSLLQLLDTLIQLLEVAVIQSHVAFHVPHAVQARRLTAAVVMGVVVLGDSAQQDGTRCPSA